MKQNGTSHRARERADTNRNAAAGAELKPATPLAEEAADLSAAEAKVLAAMAQPGSQFKSISKLCDEAGVGRTTWYRLLADPAFQAKVKTISVQMLADDLAPVFEALRSSASIPGRDGAADRRLLFEMTGIYQPTKKTIHETPAAPKDDEASLVAALLRLGVPIERWKPGLRELYESGQLQIPKQIESREVKS